MGSHVLEIALTLREFLRRPVDNPDKNTFETILKEKLKTEMFKSKEKVKETGLA